MSKTRSLLFPVPLRLATFALLGLTACMPAPVTSTDPPVASTCGAEGLQSLVGQSARVLETMKFGVVTRIITPGMAVTMDYSPERLNIEIDDAGRISRVACG